MKKNRLGQTDIWVSEITFGALTLGPLQADLPLDEGKRLILTALDKGINSIDTAESYRADRAIGAALAEYSGEVVVGTKSTAVTYQGMEKSIIGAMKGMGRDYLDIFYLHAAKVQPTVFEERSGALECLLDYRQKGYLRAVGVSTHVVQVIEKAADMAELDVVFPIINMAGLGIVGGSLEDMRRAITKASSQCKGIVAMKALGGGNLLRSIREALGYVKGIPELDTVALGMKNAEELETNLKLYNNEDIAKEYLVGLRAEKKLFINQLCAGCGICVKTCPNNALTVRAKKAVVDERKCILCGYCSPVCPNFAIRLL